MKAAGSVRQQRRLDLKSFPSAQFSLLLVVFSNSFRPEKNRQSEFGLLRNSKSDLRSQISRGSAAVRARSRSPDWRIDSWISTAVHTLREHSCVLLITRNTNSSAGCCRTQPRVGVGAGRRAAVAPVQLCNRPAGLGPGYTRPWARGSSSAAHRSVAAASLTGVP